MTEALSFWSATRLEVWIIPLRILATIVARQIDDDVGICGLAQYWVRSVL